MKSGLRLRMSVILSIVLSGPQSLDRIQPNLLSVSALPMVRARANVLPFHLAPTQDPGQYQKCLPVHLSGMLSPTNTYIIEQDVGVHRINLPHYTLGRILL